MQRKIAVIGLGYVGLPVAAAFARQGYPVLGFDVSERRVQELTSGYDRTHEVAAAELRQPTLTFSTRPQDLKAADMFIVTVPTPIDAERRPDLKPLLAASETIGRALKRGDIVVYESTVYPGATEEDCLPVLERISGLKSPADFALGYSPERINPGDVTHRIESIRKIVAAQDARTLDIVAEAYGSIIKAGIHRAPSIRVAECAKVIENTQRDLNIAFMNELSVICHKLDIDTMDVIEAAATKWNFSPFTPGLVGGHCIGVDPYYLTQRAERAGHRPEIILAGRRINNDVGPRIADEYANRVAASRRTGRVTILGLTFKENVPDIRNSRVVDIIEALQRKGFAVQVHDPMADPDETRREYGVDLMAQDALRPADGVILAVPHHDLVAAGWPLMTSLLEGGRGLVMDVKSRLDRDSKPDAISLWRL